MTSLFPTVECIGSEYINPDHIVTEINGIRHEDAEALSFPDGSIDLITSNDVLEHVNNPIQALREIFRVLKPGGVVFITIPFHAYRFGTVRRAELINGELIYYYPPIYHGNPLSEDGSLVFNDFGLDFLTKLQDIGFHDVSLCLYWSCLYGYLSAPLSYFMPEEHEIMCRS